MLTIPDHNAADLDTVLHRINAYPNDQFSPDGIQRRLLPHLTLQQIEYMMDEIIRYRPGLLVTVPAFGDAKCAFKAGPKLEEFMMGGGFKEVFQNYNDYKREERRVKELGEQSQRANIIQAEEAKKANRKSTWAIIIASFALFVSGVQTFWPIYEHRAAKKEPSTIQKTLPQNAKPAVVNR